MTNAQKWEAITMGRVVITNQKELEAIIDYLDKNPETDPDGWANRMISIPNPNRCGILDQYLAYIGFDVSEMEVKK